MRRPWSNEENETVRRLYPDYAALALALPDRSRRHLITKAGHLGLSKGAPVNKVGRKRKHPVDYTEAEIQALRDGARTLPGRTKQSVWNARRYHKIDYTPIRKVWTDAELQRCALDPFYIPEGSTRQYVLQALRRRKMPRATQDAANGTAKLRPVPGPLAGSVLAAAPNAPGADLLRDIMRLWPNSTMDDDALDTMSEMVLGILEGRFDRENLPEARRQARAIVRRSHPIGHAAPIGLDDLMPGGRGRAVIDCLRAP